MTLTQQAIDCFYAPKALTWEDRGELGHLAVSHFFGNYSVHKLRDAWTWQFFQYSDIEQGHASPGAQPFGSLEDGQRKSQQHFADMVQKFAAAHVKQSAFAETLQGLEGLREGQGR